MVAINDRPYTYCELRLATEVVQCRDKSETSSCGSEGLRAWPGSMDVIGMLSERRGWSNDRGLRVRVC